MCRSWQWMRTFCHSNTAPAIEFFSEYYEFALAYLLFPPGPSNENSWRDGSENEQNSEEHGRDGPAGKHIILIRRWWSAPRTIGSIVPGRFEHGQHSLQSHDDLDHWRPESACEYQWSTVLTSALYGNGSLMRNGWKENRVPIIFSAPIAKSFDLSSPTSLSINQSSPTQSNGDLIGMRDVDSTSMRMDDWR